jgi:hypothetical protein
MENSAIYRIRVRGKVPASWADYLHGMTITVEQSEQGREVTTLEGRLPDNARLSGVLNMLHALRVAVLSVVALDEREI